MTLEVSGLRKRLGSFSLPGLDLTVRSGEYFVLLGPSGVGKTVLLELIAGLLRPDGGRITWQGSDVTAQPAEHRRFALVYQDYALFPHLDVAANVAYGLRSRRLPAREVRRRTADIVERVGIGALLARQPGTLSGGEQQRVALARALAVQPELLLLDEPLSAVDMQLRRQLRQELKRLHRGSGTAYLHVTHDVEEALTLGERIGVMLDGRVRLTGRPEELFRRPSDEQVAAFLGMSNILAAQADGEFCHVNGVAIHIGRRPTPYSRIWIKPEEILLSRAPFSSSARNQLRCIVSGCELRDPLVEVGIAHGGLTLTALITHTSSSELALDAGQEVYATFKSSAVHCF